MTNRRKATIKKRLEFAQSTIAKDKDFMVAI